MHVVSYCCVSLSFLGMRRLIIMLGGTDGNVNDSATKPVLLLHRLIGYCHTPPTSSTYGPEWSPASSSGSNNLLSISSKKFPNEILPSLNCQLHGDHSNLASPRVGKIVYGLQEKSEYTHDSSPHTAPFLPFQFPFLSFHPFMWPQLNAFCASSWEISRALVVTLSKPDKRV